MSSLTSIISLWMLFLQLSYSQPGGNANGYVDNEKLAEMNILIAELYKRLNLNETREFLSSFSSSFERDSIYQQLEACPFTALCEYNLSVTFKPSKHSGFPCCGMCTCDFPNCLNEQSCCLDILYRNHNVSNEQPHNDKESTTKKCMRMSVSGGTDLEKKIGYANPYVIVNAECPLNTTSELRRNCTEIYSSNLREFKDLTPVYDVRTLEMYRNAYCAYCHNVTDAHLENVSVGLECKGTHQFKSEQDIIKSVMDKQKCNITFTLPPIIRPEVCDFEVSECNITGKWIEYDPDTERACSMYKTTIQLDKIVYRNIFCALCNGISNNNTAGCMSQIDFGGTSFPFTGLLKLGTHTGTDQTGNPSENDNCTLQQLYDSVYDTCRDLFCPPHKMLQDGQCSDMFTSLKRIVYTIVLKVVPIEPTTVLQGDLIADHVIDTIREQTWMTGYNCGVQMIYTVDADIGALNATDIIHSAVQYFVIRIGVSMDKYHDPEQFLEMVLSIDQLNIGVIYYEETSKSMQNFEGQLQLYHQDPEMFDRISDLSFAILYKGANVDRTLETAITYFSNIADTSGIQFPHITGRINLAWCTTTSPKVNVFQMKPCTAVKLSKYDKQWVYNSNGIALVRGDYILKNSEFYIQDKDTIVVCTHVYKKYMIHQTDVPKEFGMSIETVLSVVCSSLSIICLSFTFLAFCMLSKLRKQLPGINNMVLVILLLCAQSLYLIAGVGVLDIASTGCVVFGLVLHFIWLLSMFWMNVCTYHMFHVLTKMATVSKDSWKCRFVVYLMYAFIMTSIPVAVNIAMSNVSSDSLGYGEIICYISSQKMITYTFVVPTAFVIVTNVCMFVYVMVKIKRTSMVKNTVNHERNNLLIFVKLSTITGITWVFGFIYSWTDIVAFSYLFILLNAGQGVFIMLAFIFNFRVLNMFKSDILRQIFISSSGDVNTVNTSKECKSRNGSNKIGEHTKL